MPPNNLPTENVLVLKVVTVEQQYGGTNIIVSSRYGTLEYPLSTIQAMSPFLPDDCSGIEAHPIAISLYLVTFKIEGKPVGGEYSKGESFWSVLPVEEPSPIPMNESLFLACFLESLSNDLFVVSISQPGIDEFLEYHHKYYYPVSFTARSDNAKG